MAHAGTYVGDLPFVNLKKIKDHRWGCLRAWPKWKSIRRIWGILDALEKVGKLEVMDQALNVFQAAAAQVWLGLDQMDAEFVREGWSQVKWRPLVSYVNHHWRFLFRMLH